MVASILERTGARLVHNRAGANMAGGVATALLQAATATRRCSRSTSSGCRRSPTQVEPDALLLGNLFRDQLDRYGELESIADALGRRGRRPAGRHALVLNADDPMVADLGRDRDAVVLRRRGPARSPWPRSSTPPTPSTAGAAARPTSTTPTTSATSASTTATRAGHGARRRRSSRPTSRSTACAARGSRCGAGDASAVVALPLPGLYNVYNALGAAALATALGVALDDIVAGLQDTAPAFGRAESVPRRRARAVDPARQEPGRRQRGAAHAAPRGRPPRRARGAQRPHRRRPRRQLGLGRRLRAARRPRRPRHVRGHPRGRDGAAVQVRGRATSRGSSVAPSLRDGPRRARSTGATGRSTPCPPTPRCSSCASCCVARGAAEGVVSVSEVVWHDLECGRYSGRPAAVARAGRRRRGADARRRRGHRAGDARPRAPRPRGDGARRRCQSCSRRCRPGRRAAGLRDVRTVCADARDFAIDGEPFALIIVPMQTVQLLDGARGRVAFLRTAREHLRPGGLVALAIADALEAIDDEHHYPPEADRCELDGVTYTSTPVDVRDDGHAVVIERVREILDPGGARRADRQHGAARPSRGGAAGARGRGDRPVARAGARRPATPTSTSARRW